MFNSDSPQQKPLVHVIYLEVFLFKAKILNFFGSPSL